MVEPWEDSVYYERIPANRRLCVWVGHNLLDGATLTPTFTRWGARRLMSRYVHGLRV